MTVNSTYGHMIVSGEPLYVHVHSGLLKVFYEACRYIQNYVHCRSLLTHANLSVGLPRPYIKAIISSVANFSIQTYEYNTDISNAVNFFSICVILILFSFKYRLNE